MKWHPVKTSEKKRIHIIPNAINLNYLSTHRESIRKKQFLKVEAAALYPLKDKMTVKSLDKNINKFQNALSDHDLRK